MTAEQGLPAPGEGRAAAPGPRAATGAEPGKRIALVLGAGGARGLAHIGAIEVLQSRGYEIAMVAGSSMGALVGGIFAAGRLAEYRDWACSLERNDVLRLLDFAFGHPGLIRGDRVIAALRELVGDHLIEDLPIPYTAVASDLARQREVWLTSGRLFDAIRASIAIPMVFTPYVVDGRELVDGGLLAPVPIAATRRAWVDQVFAVDVNGPVQWRPAPAPEPDQAPAQLAAAYGVAEHDPEDGAGPGPGLRERMASMWAGLTERSIAARPKERGVMDLMSRSLDTMQAHVTRMQLAMDPPDLMIQVGRDACAFYEYWRARELIERGREATLRALDAGRP